MNSRRMIHHLAHSCKSVVASLLLYSLTAGTLFADNDESGELLQNPGFEAPTIQTGYSLLRPEGWRIFSSLGGSDEIGMSTEITHEGNQALHIAAQGVSGSFQGIGQVIPVTPRGTYEFTVYIHKDPEQPLTGTISGRLSIEWHDEDGNEIERSRSDEWCRRILRRPRWEQFSLQARAPREAASAFFVITQSDGNRPMDGGAFYVDSASIQRIR